MKTYKGLVTSLLENQVFVFGSNPEGIHGAGAAKVAANHYGAIMGRGRGHMGQSYGLVTKNLTPSHKEEETGITYIKAGDRSVSKVQMFINILELYLYAKEHPELEFLVAYTPSPNLNGYSPLEMAELLTTVTVPDNVILNEELMNMYNEYKRRTAKEIA